MFSTSHVSYNKQPYLCNVSVQQHKVTAEVVGHGWGSGIQSQDCLKSCQGGPQLITAQQVWRSACSSSWASDLVQCQLTHVQQQSCQVTVLDYVHQVLIACADG